MANLKRPPAPTGGKKAPILEAGPNVAMLLGIVDLGTQKREYKGTTKDPVRQFMFTFEIPGQTMDIEVDGEEKTVRRLFSINNVNFIGGEKAKLTKIIAALDPKDQAEDLDECLGNGVILNLKHGETKDGNKTARFDSISGLPAGIPVPELERTPYMFMWSEGEDPDMEVYKDLPDWVKEVIGQSLDYKASKLGKLVGEVKKEPEAKGSAKPEAEEGDDGDQPY